MELDCLSFVPVPVKARRDGWTPRRQSEFISLLARGAGVDSAARSVGMSRTTAYALRKRPGAESFARAWDCAQAFAKGVRAGAAHFAPAVEGPRSRADAEALLDRLYPGWRGPRAGAGEAYKDRT